MAERRALVLKSDGSIEETPTGDTIYGGGTEINPNVITVRTSGGDFTSIATALTSISGSSASNPYHIHIGPGVFTEPLIDLSSKPYVSVVGESINSTIIEPDATNHHVFKLGIYNEISFLTIQGAGIGYAGIYTSDGGDFSQAHKVSIYDCDICVLVENTTTVSRLYLEYVDYGGTFSYGVKQISTGGAENFVNCENQYAFPINSTAVCYHSEGTSSVFELLAGGCEQYGATNGIGIQIHSGANFHCQSYYINNFNTAISMPNTGSAPIGIFNGVDLFDNSISCNIAHTGATGSFIGTTKPNPTFTINTTAVFGISYLERTLGNKKSIIFDAASFNLSTGSTPTTSAASRGTLTATGFTFVTLPGTGGTTYGASVNFRIPSDYQGKGRFKLVYTSQTNANNIKFYFILSSKAIGGDLATQTETGLSSTVVATTQYQAQETSWITPTTIFTIGDTVSIRVYRNPGDAADTANVDAYIQTLIFEYESNK